MSVLPVSDNAQDWRTAGPNGTKRPNKGLGRNILHLAKTELAKTETLLQNLRGHKSSNSKSWADVVSNSEKAIQRPSNKGVPLQNLEKHLVNQVSTAKNPNHVGNTTTTKKSLPPTQQSKAKQPKAKIPKKTNSVSKPKQGKSDNLNKRTIENPSSNPDFALQVKKLNLLVRTQQALNNWVQMPSSIMDYFTKGAQNIKPPGYESSLTQEILTIMDEARHSIEDRVNAHLNKVQTSSILSIVENNTDDMDRIKDVVRRQILHHNKRISTHVIDATFVDIDKQLAAHCANTDTTMSEQGDDIIPPTPISDATNTITVVAQVHEPATANIPLTTEPPVLVTRTKQVQIAPTSNRIEAITNHASGNNKQTPKRQRATSPSDSDSEDLNTIVGLLTPTVKRTKHTVRGNVDNTTTAPTQQSRTLTADIPTTPGRHRTYSLPGTSNNLTVQQQRTCYTVRNKSSITIYNKPALGKWNLSLSNTKKILILMDSNGRLMQHNDIPSDYDIHCIPGARIQTITDVLTRQSITPNYTTCIIAVGVNNLYDSHEKIQDHILKLEATMLNHRDTKFGFLAIHILPDCPPKYKDNLEYLNDFAHDTFQSMFIYTGLLIPFPLNKGDHAHYDQAASKVRLEYIGRWLSLN